MEYLNTETRKVILKYLIDNSYLKNKDITFIEISEYNTKNDLTTFYVRFKEKGGTSYLDETFIVNVYNYITYLFVTKS